MRSFLRILLAIIFTWSFSDEFEFHHSRDPRGKSNSVTYHAVDPKMSLRSTWTLDDVIDLKHQVPQAFMSTSAQNAAGKNSISMPISYYAPKSSIIVFMYYNRRQSSDSSII